MPNDPPAGANPLACADIEAGAGLHAPPEFPADIQLPDGTVLTEVERMEKNRVLLVGAVPAISAEANDALVRRLEATGYEVLPASGQVETSATFARGGMVGFWTLSAIDSCAAASQLTLTLGPAS